MSRWRADVLAHRVDRAALLRRAQAAGARRDVLHRALGEAGAVVDALAAQGLPDRVVAAVAADLFARVCGACPRGWDERSLTRWVVLAIVPRLARVLPAEVSPLLDDLLTAATRLRGQVDLAAWAGRLTDALHAAGDARHLRDLAALAAWRSGAVMWRAAALGAAPRVPAAALA
ncbi:hypothetical protein, partial [Georgenia thermotolerans]